MESEPKIIKTVLFYDTRKTNENTDNEIESFHFTKTSVLFNDVVQTYPYNLCIITFMDITKQGM